MLEAIRRNSRSTIIYVLFGVLIAVFIINFGPGSGSSGCGKALSSSYAARVAGSVVSEQDFRATYIAMGWAQAPTAMAKERRLKEIVMDKLIERELLAQEAEKVGFSVSDKEVEDLLGTGRMYVLGIPRRGVFIPEDGTFDYKTFQKFVENKLGTNVQRFIDVQRREMLADKLRQLMLGSVKVTPAEARQVYVQKETQSNVEFVRFSPRQFEGKLELTPAEVAAYQAGHADDIKKQFEERSFLYKKVERQAKLKLILVAAAKDAEEEAVKKAEKVADKARARVEGKDGAAFAQAARELSDDEASKARGGDLGWRKPGFTGLPKELDDKVFAAKDGAVLGPERTERGFELVRVEKFREGDIPLDDVAAEIAEDRLRTEKTKALARQAAEAALKEAAGKTLAELFPRPAGDEADARKGADPVADETGLFQRRGELVPKVGLSAELMKAAFALKVGEAAGPFDVSDTWVIIKAKEHKEADLKAFEDTKDEQLRQLQREKWAEVLDEYARQLCVQARDAKRIDPNLDVLSYEGEGVASDSKYVACSSPR